MSLPEMDAADRATAWVFFQVLGHFSKRLGIFVLEIAQAGWKLPRPRLLARSASQ